jgi:hypothetical protein
MLRTSCDYIDTCVRTMSAGEVTAEMRGHSLGDAGSLITRSVERLWLKLLRRG